MSLLLGAGADIEAQDKHGMRPIHYAVKDQQEWLGLHMFGRPARQMYPFAVCQYLASKGADINAKDGEGHSALWTAAYTGARERRQLEWRAWEGVWRCARR